MPPKDKDTPKSLPQRGKIPRVDDLTSHLGNTISSPEFNKLVVEAGSQEAAVVLLIRCLNMNPDSIKALLKDGLVSFAKAKYSNIALLFHMYPTWKDYNWPTFTIPRVSLPRSIKKSLIYAGVKAFKQCGPPAQHTSEHVRVRFLGPWVSEIISLFDGCIYDMPERPMPATNTSTGGHVEYEMFVWDRAIVLLIEVKHNLGRGEKLWDQFAQVMCELDSACQMNRRIDLKDFPIYAILTDSFNWHFIAYDGAQNQFFLDEAITIPDRAGSDGLLYLRAMINICNRIFGMFLQGFINTLKAYENKSFQRGLAGDEGELPSSCPLPIPKSQGEAVQRGSTEAWVKRVTAIEECQGTFETAFKLFNGSNPDAAEKQANLGLQQLKNCVEDMASTDGSIDPFMLSLMVETWDEHGDNLIDV